MVYWEGTAMAQQRRVEVLICTSYV